MEGTKDGREDGAIAGIVGEQDAVVAYHKDGCFGALIGLGPSQQFFGLFSSECVSSFGYLDFNLGVDYLSFESGPRGRL